jgi:hypothetical protein
MKKQIRKVLAGVGIFLVVIMIIGGLLAGVYITGGVNALLNLPGMKAILGLDRPKDLAMGEITDADRASLIAKLGGDPAGWVEASTTTERVSVTATLTAKETAAFLMSGKGSESFQQLQLDITEDGWIIVSGIVQLDGVLTVADMSRADLEEQIGALPNEVPFYLELKTAPTESGSFGITVRQLKIGSITIPGSSLGLDPVQLDPYVRKFFLSTYGVELDSLATSGGVFLLEMKAPID